MQPITHAVLQFILIATLAVQGRYISSDNLNNLYVITNDNSLAKYDSTGKQLFTYNAKKYGQLKTVDATNPLKLVLYYPDFTTAVLLDNTLSELSVMNLKRAGIVQPACVCLASDNNVWVYDAQEFKLKKLSQNIDVLVESADLSSVLQQAIEPTMMMERDNFVFLNDSARGIFVFDNYGAYSHLIPITGLTDFQVFNGKLFFYRAGGVNAYDMQTMQIESSLIDDNETGILQMRLEKDRLFLLRENEVALYRY